MNVVYDIEWRHEWRHADGGLRRTTRAARVEGGEAVKRLVAEVADDAVGREFVLRCGSNVKAFPSVCLHAAEVRAWVIGDSILPRSLMATDWARDAAAESHRWRIYATVAAALSEAMTLRVARRRDVREALSHLRNVLGPGRRD